jgi:hypothetical protein
MRTDDFASHIATTASCRQQIYDAVVDPNLDSAKEALSRHIKIVQEDVFCGLERMREDKHNPIF